MIAQTRPESEYRNLLRCHNLCQLLALHLGVTKIKIFPGTPDLTKKMRLWPMEERIT
jgi:hypothetical protein